MSAAGDYAEQMQQRVAAKWAAIEAEVEAEEAPIGDAVEPYDEAQAEAIHAANLAFVLASEQAEAQQRALASGTQQPDVALPFRADPDAPPPASAAEDVAREGAEQAGETAFVAALTDEDLAEALPFPDVPELPELSVEQYASLCVERRLAPEGELSVAQRYQVLTLQALQALDSRWRNRFAEEGELYQRWQHAYQQYEAWLAKGRQ